MRKIILSVLLALILATGAFLYRRGPRLSAPTPLDTPHHLEFDFAVYYPHDPPAVLMEKAQSAIDAQPGP